MFGSPRVFSYSSFDKVKGILNTVLIRVTHYNDVVPKLPFGIANFRHFGTEIYYPLYNDWNTFRECKDVGIDEPHECLNSVITFGIASHLLYLGISVSRKCGYLSELAITSESPETFDTLSNTLIDELTR